MSLADSAPETTGSTGLLV